MHFHFGWKIARNKQFALCMVCASLVASVIFISLYFATVFPQQLQPDMSQNNEWLTFIYGSETIGCIMHFC